MIPFRFGPHGRQLSGVYHPPAPGQSREPGAVLLCNPFGQEAVRTHRMYRVLADRLSRSGQHVLRFDYFGTGDSDGDDCEGKLSDWQGDVLLAHDALAERSLGAPIRWLGVRLGATLALMASNDAPDRPRQLVLWEPILDGDGYLQQMTQAHHRALAASYGVVPRPLRTPPQGELLGFEISAELQQGLHTLELPKALRSSAAEVRLLGNHGVTHLEPLAAHLRSLGSRVDTQSFDVDFDWSSEEALNTALVPQEAIQTLARLVATDA